MSSSKSLSIFQVLIGPVLQQHDMPNMPWDEDVLNMSWDEIDPVLLNRLILKHPTVFLDLDELGQYLKVAPDLQASLTSIMEALETENIELLIELGLTSQQSSGLLGFYCGYKEICQCKREISCGYKPPEDDDKPPKGDDKPPKGDDKPPKGDDKPPKGDDKPSAEKKTTGIDKGGPDAEGANRPYSTEDGIGVGPEAVAEVEADGSEWYELDSWDESDLTVAEVEADGSEWYELDSWDEFDLTV